ncbi:MAG: hypothetical protein QOI59_4793 [Gammaproteobacteria bacterium]|jgi:hypothetical protein|nr:hypothetical protein [Gammaproteobacteria bacterium]
MLSASYAHEFAADAAEAPQALVVARVPADQPIADTFAAELGIARRAALNEPAVAAQLLSAWMTHNG